MTIVSTDDVRPAERVEFWEDLVSRHITPVCIEPSAPQGLHGWVQAKLIGGLGVAEVSGRGMRASHGRRHIARARDHVYSACVNLAGEARISSRGQDLILRPGDVFFTDSRYEFELGLERPWRHLVITLPTSWIDARVARPDRISGLVLNDHPLARLWAGHLVSGFAMSGDLSPDAANLFGRYSVDLLAQVVEGADRSCPTLPNSGHAAIHVRACYAIELRFADPTLTPAKLAKDLNVSTRTLARSFAFCNETVMQRVFDERVRRAASLLKSPKAASRTATDIAFACGFNDSSHFGRVFAARMNMTPTQWRVAPNAP